jgi:5'-deoxynucleotidase YfbR-like HD superfamily hydrolase
LQSERLGWRTDRVWRNHTVEHEPWVVAVLSGELDDRPSRPRRAPKEEGKKLVREHWPRARSRHCKER